jgi:hypothetical protein
MLTPLVFLLFGAIAHSYIYPGFQVMDCHAVYIYESHPVAAISAYRRTHYSYGLLSEEITMYQTVPATNAGNHSIGSCYIGKIWPWPICNVYSSE